MADENKLDWRFDLPPFSTDLSYEGSIIPSEDTTDTGVEDYEPGESQDSPEDDFDDEEETALAPPDSIEVIEWVTRVGEGGTIVTDAIIEVDGDSGITSYEVRVVKS